jgi:hypothetical protein
MKNLRFKLLIWLLKHYAREVDQFDHFKISDGKYDWFISIEMEVPHPSIYREL